MPWLRIFWNDAMVDGGCFWNNDMVAMVYLNDVIVARGIF